jgi:hypothetical protein
MNSEPDLTLPWAKPEPCQHKARMRLPSLNMDLCYDCKAQLAIDPRRPMLPLPETGGWLKQLKNPEMAR